MNELADTITCVTKYDADSIEFDATAMIGDMTQQISREFIILRDKHIHEALVKLGWAAPGTW